MGESDKESRDKVRRKIWYWVLMMQLEREQYWIKWRRQLQDSRGETIEFCTISKGSLVRQLIHQVETHLFFLYQRRYSQFTGTLKQNGNERRRTTRRPKEKDYSGYLGWTSTILELVEPEERRAFMEKRRDVVTSPVVSLNVILLRV